MIAHKEQMSKIMDYGFDGYLNFCLYSHSEVFWSNSMDPEKTANQEIIKAYTKCIIYE